MKRMQAHTVAELMHFAARLERLSAADSPLSPPGTADRNSRE
jgi:hypothetical protein